MNSDQNPQKCAHLIGHFSSFIRRNGAFELQTHGSQPSFRQIRWLVRVVLLPLKPLFDFVRGLSDFMGRPNVEAFPLVVGARVGSLELSMPTTPVAIDDKKGMCFCFGGDATVNFLLLVGRMAVVQAEMAPVRSVPALCSTGSFGHNLVATGLKKASCRHRHPIQGQVSSTYFVRIISPLFAGSQKNDPTNCSQNPRDILR